MNSRLEVRRNRQNRAIALFLTLLFHIALFGGIYYYNADNEADTMDQSENVVNSEQEVPTQKVANERSLKP